MRNEGRVKPPRLGYIISSLPLPYTAYGTRGSLAKGVGTCTFFNPDYLVRQPVERRAARGAVALQEEPF